jgi:CBS domain-containing protein
MRQLHDIVFDQKPLTLPPTATVKEACQSMRDRRAGTVLVTEADGTLVGIFTGRDAVCRVLAVGADATATRLLDVMTENPATMSPCQTAIDALRLMWDKGFRHVPLLKAGKIMGVVSRGDFQGYEHSRHEQERDLWENMR